MAMNKKLKWTLIGAGALITLSVIGKIMGSGEKDEKVTVEKVAPTYDCRNGECQWKDLSGSRSKNIS